MSLIGIIGTLKKFRIPKHTYHFSTIIFVCGYVGLGIMTLQVTSKYKNDMTCPSYGVPWFFNANVLYEGAQQLFCQDERCVCKITDFGKFPAATLKKLHYYSQTSGYTSVIQCPDFQKYMEVYNRYSDFLQILSSNFGCSGLCQQEDIFFFSNVNDGQVKHNCLHQLKSFFGVYSLKYQIVSWAMALILLTNYLIYLIYNQQSSR